MDGVGWTSECPSNFRFRVGGREHTEHWALPGTASMEFQSHPVSSDTEYTRGALSPGGVPCEAGVLGCEPLGPD